MKLKLNLTVYIIIFYTWSSLSLAAKITIPHTGQTKCYNNVTAIPCPQIGQDFYGQDAQYQNNFPKYQNNNDGTITDLITGLMWSQAVDSNKVSLIEAENISKKMTLAGHNDWRVPNIKELYSLINFNGYTGFMPRGMNNIPNNATPFIDTTYFDFKFGQINLGERYIDGQWLSNTKYVSTTMHGAMTLFGVNFVDGRIKGYGYKHPTNRGPRREKKFYVRYVRGSAYGYNDFIDNGNGTITDRTTNLMWMQNDNGTPLSWQEALAYADNLIFANYSDWRLPNAKELQYIVDYTRAPDITDSATINPLFKTSEIINEAGQKDYPCYWTATTHLDGPHPGTAAVYIAFGRAIGRMRGDIMDVHGAGAQRSDPKTGSPTFRGPQGDAIRIKNYARCVRNINKN